MGISDTYPIPSLVSTLVELLGRTVLVGIVLVGTLVLDVVLVVHVAGALLGVALGSLLVVEVHAFGLGELINFTADETSEQLLGESVVDSLAWRDISSLPSTSSSKDIETCPPCVGDLQKASCLQKRQHHQ